MIRISEGIYIFVPTVKILSICPEIVWGKHRAFFAFLVGLRDRMELMSMNMMSMSMMLALAHRI